MTANDLALLMAALLDPFRIIVVLIVLWRFFNWWGVAAAIILSAILSEALLTEMQHSRNFGEGLLAGIVASSLITAICYYFMGVWKAQRRRKQ